MTAAEIILLVTAIAGLLSSAATAFAVVVNVLPKLKEVRGLVDGVAHDLKEANKRADHSEGMIEGMDRVAAAATPTVAELAKSPSPTQRPAPVAVTIDTAAGPVSVAQVKPEGEG